MYLKNAVWIANRAVTWYRCRILWCFICSGETVWIFKVTAFLFENEIDTLSEEATLSSRIFIFLKEVYSVKKLLQEEADPFLIE